MLKGKNIILGVTGSIAAYKSAILVRMLVKNQASVKVIMTGYAKEFITPLTLATLSNNPVLADFYNPENGDWNSHVDLGLWADALVIAPATANTIAKMAGGIADNLLLTTYLSARCPVFVAPAMDLDMFNHPATQKNIKSLAACGNIIIEPATGDLASGLSGKGRMEEPETIIQVLDSFFRRKEFKKKVREKIAGKKILITAGPTFEAIDPVRFIGNHSSGRMGYAIAESLAELEAEVVLISGPASLQIDNTNITVISVTSAEEMYLKCRRHYPHMDGAILSAAVADYRPVKYEKKKIKSSDKNLMLELEPTRDIAVELGKIKKSNQFLVGFALETDNKIENAYQKLKRKNFDFIVINSLDDQGAGFQNETNKISILNKGNKLENFELKSKKEVAKDIVLALSKIL
ncbi:MAG TPA: bifunctional phosphopantothenoylcysteine decarboxylase/phosphopantothenate--cysteine ligase CoaBC [Bacteroidales bacterium]|nr:bifunctional phosphopantothenoylcysteine decarboxylase/phosphopantothenate--cysteine ligase CoaBC [Bacteroidales bacterium]